MKYPLLLTGTINASVYNLQGNRINDTDDRLRQYESAITRYISETPFNPIVFIENSGYDFDCNKFIKLANDNGENFEFISGTVCVNEVFLHGKSYGDAFLIHEALEKSVLLENVEFFYKITGRIFLKNSKKIVLSCKKSRNEFIAYPAMGWCFTNIFKVNKSDYINVLDDVYLSCDELSCNDIEISFYKRIRDSNMETGSFFVFPYFDGVMGATLQNYSGGVCARFVRNILARMQVFRIGSKSSELIKIYMKIRRIKSYL